MSAASKSSSFPETVQPGKPKLPKRPPDGWQRTRFGDHLFEERRPVKMVDDEQYDLVTVKRARGGVVKRGTKRGADISVKTQFEVKAGDFLISKRQIVHGACGLVPGHLDGATVSNEYTVLRGGKSIDLDFLKHFSHSIYFQQTCFHSSIGVHIEKMLFKTDKWFRWEFDLPPISEQQRIASALSTWDEAIEVSERLIANSEVQKRGLVQKLLPLAIPERETQPLGEIADVFAGGTPSTSAPEYWGGEIPWMNSGEINLRQLHDVGGRITKSGMTNSSTKMVPVNSVLIALAGQGKTRGKVAINRIPLCTNQSLAAIVPQDGVDVDYLFHNLDARYHELRGLSLGDGGRGGLNLSIVKNVPVWLPPVEHQRKIAAILNTADSEIESLKRLRRELHKERKALLQQLLTGKRRVKIKKEAAA